MNEQNKTKIYKEAEKERKRKWYYDNKERARFVRDKYATGTALYNTYSNQLTVEEEPRLSDDNISLEVRCRYCGKYFKPTNRSVLSRMTAVKGNKGEHNLYCSEGCKHSCSTYRQQRYSKDHKLATSREVHPQLRKLVLERDNWTCQKCGSTDTLHCHHIDPIKNNPIESADIDNCITFCIDCHIESHQQDGCRYNELVKC